MSYAAVFPLVRTRAFAEAFDYEVPAHLATAAQAGALVAAPLGARTVIGVVLEIRDASGHEGRVLPLHDVLHVPPVPPGLLDLARRVERHYLSSFAAALTLVCPPVGALKVDRRYELTEAGAAAVAAGEEALGALGGVRLPAGPLPPEHERYRRRGWLRVAYRARVVGVLDEIQDEPDWSIFMPMSDLDGYNAWVTGQRVDRDIFHHASQQREQNHDGAPAHHLQHPVDVGAVGRRVLAPGVQQVDEEKAQQQQDRVPPEPHAAINEVGWQFDAQIIP